MDIAARFKHKTRHYLNYCTLATLMSACLVYSTATLAMQAGEIKFTRGAVTVQKEDGSGARLVGKGDTLQRGEVIKTGPKSYAILNLADDTRMTLRPRTAFAVEHMELRDDNKANALLRLFRGGFRAITGLISKQNPRGYRVKTSVATIGIRGTEFDARLCEDDCQQETDRLEKKQKHMKDLAVGHVAFKQGDLRAVDFADNPRPLDTKSRLFEGDTLSTGDNSYAIIVFKDKSRISLHANTEFRIDELRFDQVKRASNSALYSLLRGGLRTLTGLIGKLRPEAYKMRTTVATIGIRGTGYDLICSGACASNGQEVGTLPNGEGLYASVWEGSIYLGDHVVKNGQTAYIRDASTPPLKLTAPPRLFKDTKLPRPDRIDIDEDELDLPDARNVPPGLYVSVRDGKVAVESSATGQVHEVSQGQSSYTDASGRLTRPLPAVPLFQQLDKYPTPDTLTPKMLDIGNTIIGEDGEGLVCEIQ